MPNPFGSATWIRRSNIPELTLFGVVSGPVGGPGGAVYDKESLVVQSFARQANHFQGFVNTAQASVDDGKTWTTTFNEAVDVNLDEVAFTGWSMPHPSGVGRIHFMVRFFWRRSFFVASGDIVTPGGVKLYVSGDGLAFTFLQDLHNWPTHLADPVNTGGAAIFHAQPSVSQPYFQAGSGPAGEDAWWLISAFSFEAGGTSNRVTFRESFLWRSLDDGITWERVRDMGPVLGYGSFSNIQRGASGRIVVVHAIGATSFTDGSLLTGSFTASLFSGSPGVRGGTVEMGNGAWLTHGQGSLTGAGSAWVSCDNCANFTGTNDNVVPQNRNGIMVKLNTAEALIVSPGFSDPVTQTTSKYTNNGGEDWVESDVWLASSIGEFPVMMALRKNGRPIVVTLAGGVFVSSDEARGVIGERTMCPLAFSGLAAVAPLKLCGLAIQGNQCD